jgi:hypothetical protein
LGQVSTLFGGEPLTVLISTKSLYLGRMPALPDLPLDHSPELRKSATLKL